MIFKSKPKQISKSKAMRQVEILLQIPIEDFLRIEYEKYKLNTRQISAKIFKLTGQRVSYPTVARWLKRCNIKPRKQCWE